MPFSRRVLLAATGLVLTGCGVIGRSPATPDGVLRIAYGTGPSQFADLHLPTGTSAGPGPVGVAVVVHGGFWKTGYGLDLGTPLAADLAANGIAALNVEYRRVGSGKAGGGGWPTTLEDVAAAVDALADPALTGEAADQLDLTRVVGLGHSAGGHLVGWLGSRSTLPAGTPGAGPRVPLTGFVSQSGVLDLVRADSQRMGDGAVADLMGGRADALPDAYASASPIARVPTGLPSVCVHGTADGLVAFEQSERYVAAATAAGDRSRLIPIDGADHFAVINVGTPAWAACRSAVQELLG